MAATTMKTWLRTTTTTTTTTPALWFLPPTEKSFNRVRAKRKGSSNSHLGEVPRKKEKGEEKKNECKWKKRKRWRRRKRAERCNLHHCDIIYSFSFDATKVTFVTLHVLKRFLLFSLFHTPTFVKKSIGSRDDQNSHPSAQNDSSFIIEATAEIEKKERIRRRAHEGKRDRA